MLLATSPPRLTDRPPRRKLGVLKWPFRDRFAASFVFDESPAGRATDSASARPAGRDHTAALAGERPAPLAAAMADPTRALCDGGPLAPSVSALIASLAHASACTSLLPLPPLHTPPPPPVPPRPAAAARAEYAVLPRPKAGRAPAERGRGPVTLTRELLELLAESMPLAAAARATVSRL